VPIQLPLFPDAASLIRIRPEHNEWRFYRMEIGPICSATLCWCANGVASAPRDGAGWIRIPILAPPSTRSPVLLGASAAAGIKIAAYDQATARQQHQQCV